MLLITLLSVLLLDDENADWQAVPLEEFLVAYDLPSEQLAAFYGNSRFDVVDQTESAVYHLQSLNSDWFSEFQYSGESKVICVTKTGGSFRIRLSDATEEWEPEKARPGAHARRSFPGDVGLGAYAQFGQTYLESIRSAPDQYRIFRKGPLYQIRFEFRTTDRVADRFYELDTTRGWVCVRHGLTWRDSGSFHPTRFTYTSGIESDSPPILKQIVMSAPGEEDETILIKNFQAAPAKPEVFRLSTYGLPESLLAPDAPPWKWSSLLSPFVLIPVGLVFLIAAFRLRR